MEMPSEEREMKDKNEKNKNDENKVLEIIKKYSGTKSPLLSILEEIQQNFGYIPKSLMLTISEQLGIPLSRVYSVATFYNDFKKEKRGQHLIRICLGTACCVKEADANLELLEKAFGIKAGSTTPDNFVTLETVNCFGACNLGPIVEVDGKIISKVDGKKIKNILNGLKKNKNAK